jgi:NAD-dependent DNA ligase
MTPNSKKMGEASQFIFTVRLEKTDRRRAEAALGRIGGQTIDSVSTATPPVSDD